MCTEMKTRHPRCALESRLRKAISLAEVLVVIAVLGVMAAVAIPAIDHVLSGSTASTAQKNLNFLNGAVLAFNQSNWELVLNPSMGSDDELLIFKSLCYRHPTTPAPGSPYLPATASYHATSANDTYRAEWNGRMFQIVEPGSTGAGINLLQLVDGPTSEMVYATNYQPVGPQP